jgi:hypothetical protein
VEIYKQLRFTEGGFERYVNDQVDLWHKLNNFLNGSDYKTLKDSNNQIAVLLIKSIDEDDLFFKTNERILVIPIAKHGKLNGKQILLEKVVDEKFGLSDYLYLFDIRKHLKHFELKKVPKLAPGGILDKDDIGSLKVGLSDLSDEYLGRPISICEANDYLKKKFPEF